MIPEFPNFKKIELSDRADVEKFTRPFPAYSDFSFVSMWAWDIKGEMRLSELNGNLVVRFTDYLTGEQFLSFLGKEKVNETIDQLLTFSKKEKIKQVLKLLPEDVINKVDRKKFLIKEDRDHFDYIYKIDELKNLAGGKFARKRNQVSLFLKSHPGARADFINLKEKNIQASITNLFLEWLKRKRDSEEIFESHEEVAVSRLLLGMDDLNLIGVGVFVEDKLIAFIINEITDAGYVIAHASKIDRSYDGVNSFLIKSNAEILSTFDKTLFNYEQDLGVENLRVAKSRFRHHTFLKKYQLTYV